ncbi:MULTISPECIES: radical SAM-associated putative lipoprotein [Parabacteroides]|uniref:radical SAM-associated putative lipoprotein n=1 Tax=Parabacteroides leei TaxID=2939491 RepID=UPI00189823F7|nr:radical SAM-associated putative lipoprotein [Parabacteroides goldsteinii]
MNGTNHFFLTFTNRILAGLLTLLGFSVTSCGGEDEYGCPYAEYEIKGKVVNDKGAAIPNIQVVIPAPFEANEYMWGDTVTTNKSGEFDIKPAVTSFGEDITFKIKTKDIDGEANGGLFEDKETEIAFKKEDLKGANGNWYYGKATKEVTITMKQAVKE